MLPGATSIIVAEVISATRPTIDAPKRDAAPDEPNANETGDDGDDDDDDDSVIEAQECVLVVISVLKGSLLVGARVSCVKPAGEYELPLGFHGPILLNERMKPAMILGRYGPDSYKLAEIKRALKQRR